MNRPTVGIGVVIINDKHQVLIGKRKNSHAPYYSIPGGHMELGESFEQAAIREIAEETGLTLIDPKVIAVTNNLRTFKQEGHHSVSVILTCQQFNGQPQLLEPHKCESWQWVEPTDLPQPHFDASESAIKCYLEQCCYCPISVQ